MLLMVLSCKPHQPAHTVSKSDSIAQNIEDTVHSSQSDTVHRILKPYIEAAKLDSLYRLVYTKCDTLAFRKLELYYEFNAADEFLACAIFMANKTKFPSAFFRVYAILSQGNYRALHHLDDQTITLAMYYLVKSYELGYPRAALELESMYPNKNFKKSADYLADYGKN